MSEESKGSLTLPGFACTSCLSLPGLTGPLEPSYHEKMYRGQAMIPWKVGARERVRDRHAGFR